MVEAAGGVRRAGEGGWLSGLAIVALAGLLAVPALAGATVTGDRSAYDEPVAAFTKPFSLPGFRAKSTNAG